jgi:hypothetical protein
MDDRGSIPGRGREFFLYLLSPDQLWSPSSFLSNGYLRPEKIWTLCEQLIPGPPNMEIVQHPHEIRDIPLTIHGNLEFYDFLLSS